MKKRRTIIILLVALWLFPRGLSAVEISGSSGDVFGTAQPPAPPSSGGSGGYTPFSGSNNHGPLRASDTGDDTDPINPPGGTDGDGNQNDNNIPAGDGVILALLMVLGYGLVKRESAKARRREGAKARRHESMKARKIKNYN